MSRFLLTLSCCLALTATLHASDPMSFQELSLLVRAGENPQSIADEVNRRKLLEPLTAAQENTLRANGAVPSLLTFLHSPQLIATPEAVAAYHAHHQAPPPSLPPETPAAPAAPAAPALTAAIPVAPPPSSLRDYFNAGIEASSRAPSRAVKASDAFSLSQLTEAKAKAVRERKPLGFILVWGQYFDKPTSTHACGGGSGPLLHFVEAFKDSLVLVFVRHETELQQVPRAVATGLLGPDEGGYAPNMAVVDATASEFIVEVPCAAPDSTLGKRDAVFRTAAGKINAWLSTHPTAIGGASPAPGVP